ncbi:MAG: thioredoxin domain-containing protein, partial [Alphaproteobacteria bacterium]
MTQFRVGFPVSTLVLALVLALSAFSLRGQAAGAVYAKGDMAIGATDAPVTIIEYASMTCPHCANFHMGPFKELKAEYIDTGKVRLIFREFPLDALALQAA